LLKWMLAISVGYKVLGVLVFFALKIMWPKGAAWMKRKAVQPFRWIRRLAWRREGES